MNKLQFDIKKKVGVNHSKYKEDDLDLAMKFAKKIHAEFSTFVKAVVLFGSAARKEKAGDVDVLVVIDDVGVILSPELQETYRIIVEKVVAEVSMRLHITTIRFSSFWEYARGADPVAVNMLRDGVPLIDSGFFEPLQHLLREGRIRPTPEAVYAYFNKAPITLHNSRWHIMQATMDLYWAVIDSGHAVLMLNGIIPPSPAHVADLLDDKLAKEKVIDKKHPATVRKFYQLSKMIMHREIQEISGEDYEKYRKEAQGFVDAMKELLDKSLKK